MSVLNQPYLPGAVQHSTEAGVYNKTSVFKLLLRHYSQLDVSHVRGQPNRGYHSGYYRVGIRFATPVGMVR